MRRLIAAFELFGLELEAKQAKFFIGWCDFTYAIAEKMNPTRRNEISAEKTLFENRLHDLQIRIYNLRNPVYFKGMP